MSFEEWEPWYREIIAYFAIDPRTDEDAAQILAGLTKKDDIFLLDRCCRGKTVTVCGNARSLRRQLGCLQGVIFAADAAALVLMRNNILPDAVFTDLDGATDEFIVMNEQGTIMVVHAHGDNIPLLRHWVPRFHGPLVATTQARPFSGMHNFGGFTDGDRAVFAAHALGAREVGLIGFDLDDPAVDPMKRGKLYWARRLLALLGHEL
ncbi:MAG: DUF115 domain-containing protein [Methanomicrobiales archaeon]|nr:DUF115 domain-containing protein [Methanomicrobiales archaeon]